jgi:hypothetical protein
MIQARGLRLIQFEINQDIVLFQTMFLKGSKIYIQEVDPVNGRPQSFFTIDGKLLGTMKSNEYYDIEKYLVIL